MEPSPIARRGWLPWLPASGGRAGMSGSLSALVPHLTPVVVSTPVVNSAWGCIYKLLTSDRFGFAQLDVQTASCTAAASRPRLQSKALVRPPAGSGWHLIGSAARQRCRRGGAVASWSVRRTDGSAHATAPCGSAACMSPAFHPTFAFAVAF